MNIYVPEITYQQLYSGTIGKEMTFLKVIKNNILE